MPACCWSRSAAIVVEADQSAGANLRRSRAGPCVWVARAGYRSSTAAPRCLFMRGRHGDLNIRGAYLHMVADTGRFARRGGARRSIMMHEHGCWLDPAISLVIAAVVLVSGWGLIASTASISRSTPCRSGIELRESEGLSCRARRVSEVHDLHIWAMSTNETALTAHLVRPGGHDDTFLHHASAKGSRTVSGSTTRPCRSRSAATPASSRRRRWCNQSSGDVGSLALRDRGRFQRRTDSACEFQRVVIGPEVNEEHAGLFVQHVVCIAVTSISPARRARISGLTSLPVTKKIAGDRGFAVAGRLEVDGVGAAERAVHLHSRFPGSGRGAARRTDRRRRLPCP